MKTIKQAFRRPILTVMGTLVIAMAVAVLCICLGQFIVANNTEAALEYAFTTVALPTSKYQHTQSDYAVTMLSKMPEEIATWVQQISHEYPELVKSISAPGLASAYIPALKIDNYTQHDYTPTNWRDIVNALRPRTNGMPYSCAMLEIVLSEVGQPAPQNDMRKQADGTYAMAETSIRVELVGTVTAVIGLEEGYVDPTGFTARVALILPDENALDTLNLTVGEKYLVFGMDYCDADWKLRGEIDANSRDGAVGIDQFNPENLTLLSPEIVEKNKENNPNSYTVAYYNHNGKTIALSQNDIKKFRSITLTAKDVSVLREYDWTENGDGSLTPELRTTRSYMDENGGTVVCSIEEYHARYAVPTIVHIPNTAEALLSSEEGSLWMAALEQIRINSHSFPVIGVEKLGYIADFARESARIVQGRDFTQEELDSGAKVCVISQTLAAKNGLSVGDTISLQYYHYDFDSPYQRYISDGAGVVDPTAYFYTSTTELLEEVEYTIVGLYRRDNEWAYEEGNIYSFTPNTVFAPKTSVSGSMDYADQAFFRTLILHNGTVEEFRALVDGANYEGLFVYYDQGYTVVAAHLHNYQEVAKRALWVGLAVYGIILILFLFLFPGSQKKTLFIMIALGTQRRDRLVHMMLSSAAILMPGSVVGVLAGTLLWQQVVDALKENAGAVIELRMDVSTLVIIVLGQLLLALTLTAIMALPMTRDRGLAKRM